MFNQYGYQPNGSNHHDHLCRCPACDVQDITPNEAPTESEMDAMFIAYGMNQPPTYQLGPENFTLCVLMEDAILHDDEHPFCFDLSCPCHTDQDLLRQYSTKPVEHGLLTQREARRLWLSEVL